jgi:hypothetical protein
MYIKWILTVPEKSYTNRNQAETTVKLLLSTSEKTYRRECTKHGMYRVTNPFYIVAWQCQQ